MTKEQFEEGFNYAEDNFLNEAAPHLKTDKQLIRERFNLDGLKVLDFGCGMGGMSLWYATNFDCQVHGLDIDGHHIEVAQALQKKHNVKNVLFEKRNLLDGPLQEKYDFIVLNDVAEHIALPILQDIFDALADTLAPGGRVFVSYPPWRGPYASHVDHIVGIPWCQFLPEKMLLKRIAKNNRAIVGDLESSLLDAYKGLNHLTHEKLTKVTQKAGLKPVFRNSHSLLKKLPGLKNMNINFFPFDFIVTKEFLVLESKKQATAGSAEILETQKHTS